MTIDGSCVLCGNETTIDEFDLFSLAYARTASSQEQKTSYLNNHHWIAALRSP